MMDEYIHIDISCTLQSSDDIYIVSWNNIQILWNLSKPNSE